MLFTVSCFDFRPMLLWKEVLISSVTTMQASYILYRIALCILGPPNIALLRRYYCPTACYTCRKRPPRISRIWSKRAHGACPAILSSWSCRSPSRSNCRWRSLWKVRSQLGVGRKHIDVWLWSSPRYSVCSSGPSRTWTTRGRNGLTSFSYILSGRPPENHWCPRGPTSVAAWCCWPSFYSMDDII